MPMCEEEPKDQQLLVVLRIRPLSDAELEEGATVIAHKVGDQMVVLMDPGEDAEDALRTHRSREKTFIFDTVFDQHATQKDVYSATTQHLVESVVSGYNATVFAYGPSGAGKTYSMLGMDSKPGIYLQALRDLFQAIEDTRNNMDYSVSMSYLEIYNEVIRDLLNPSSGLLELREDARGSIQIAGITEVSTSNAHEIMQLLTKGNRQRTQEPTAANTTSSRSHAVLQVTVRQHRRGTDLPEEVRVGRLFLVDLAGSERASQTQNRGKRMKEGAHINRSLLALGNCINALSEKGSRAQYVNFRDSKLTRLLKDALGGNSRTVMIAHISPASTHFEESRSTLLYAYRAKNIKTRVKRNLLSVSYHIEQYTDVISDLRREIEHLKSKIEKQEKEKKSQACVRDAPAMISPSNGEEDSHLQMNKIRAQLIGAFTEQLEMRRSLVELENTLIELHVDMSRHLLTIADWERERSHRAPQEPVTLKDEEPTVADGDHDGEEAAEPHEVALARDEVNMLLAEQRKTEALKAELEQRLANAKKKASQLERLLPGRSTSAEQREVLQLLCRVHELEVSSTELQAHNLRRKNLLCQKDFVIQRYHQHRLLCEQLIRDQRLLIQEAGVPVPEALEQRYRLYSRELGEGSLNRLLLLHSVMSSSLRDGSVLCISPAPEEATYELQADRKDLPWGAQFELPPILLETDSDGHKSAKGSPYKSVGKADALLPPASVRILLTPPSHEQSSPMSVKGFVSKLYPGTSLETLSAQALREMAQGTKSIALIAASRRSKAQDHDGSSGRSSLHPPDDPSLDSRDPSPADWRGRRASLGRDHSLERKARKKRSPSLTRVMVPEPPAEIQPTTMLQLSKSPGKSFFPAVPTAAKIKPSLSFHTDEHMLSFSCPTTVLQRSVTPSRVPLLPRDIRGSMDSGNHRHSPLPPRDPRKPLGGSAKRPRRPR